jgi:pimeloyl-ACP methyl ester carboxylesterase
MIGVRAALLSIITLAAACSGSHPAEPARPTIALSPCTVEGVDGECGSISVFENRSTNTGRRIDIRAMVLRANVPSPREAVFMFSGGPGTGSTLMAPVADGWARVIRESLDVVLVDQRGTGASHPLPCPSNAETDPASIFGHVYDVKHIAACRDVLERDADLTQYTTDRAVADVDDVRAALGYQRISLFGSSYGTRMAQAYMRRFPDRVRSVVLDGVAPMDTVLPLTYAAGTERALERIIGACAANVDCQRAHPRLESELKQLIARLDTTPIQGSVRTSENGVKPVSMHRGDVGYAVRGILYSPAAAAALPGLIARAATSGDGSELAQLYWNRRVRFDDTLALGAHLSVECAEDVPFVSDQEIGPATAGTLLGRYLFDEYRAACGAWRRAAIAPDARKPVTARVPTLLVSGSFDPVTPPEFAERVARWLPRSRTIVSPTGAHGSSTGCARDAVLFVLARGTLDGIPEVCK